MGKSQALNSKCSLGRTGFYKSKSEFEGILREAGSLHLPQGEFAERQSAKGSELTMSVLPLGDDRVRHWFQRVEVLNILFIDGEAKWLD